MPPTESLASVVKLYRSTNAAEEVEVKKIGHRAIHEPVDNVAERAPDDPARESPVVSASARNRLTGIVTRVVRDTVMAQVELQVGPHRVVSLMSREAADELGLEPGVLAVATVKSTNVGIEIPEHR